ncbi:MAG: hypothetical protein ABSF89_17870 [Acidimicrobiales bacterium]
MSRGARKEKEQGTLGEALVVELSVSHRYGIADCFSMHSGD